MESDGSSTQTYPHFATQAIHAGQDPEQWKSLAVVPPISLSTTFKQHVPGEPLQYEYSRGGNPTRTVFETCIASLEAAKYAIAASSGLAAQSNIMQILNSGDHIVSTGDLYGGTHRQFRLVVSKFGITSSYIDATDLSQVEAAIKDNTKMVWVESCANPLLRMVDLKALVELVKSKSKDIIVVVDNTFMTPYFLRPLELGADIVLHSVTKYLNGHSDVLMGVLCLNDDELEKRLRFIQFAVGMVPSPFDCYLANRGLKTLHLRMREHERNAKAVARLLSTSPHVTDTIYPGGSVLEY
jgi:cystathionine gamma-lyase